MKRVKAGIIGTGFTVGIADQHVKAYQANERVELAGFYDIVPNRSAEWAEKKGYKEIKIFDNLDEMLDAVDVVSICTPNYTHPELVKKVVEAGKHFICEKPFATSYEEGLKAAEALKSRPDIIGLIGFNYREIPGIKYMKSIIDAGKIGKVYTCRQILGGNRIADPENVKLEWRMQENLSGTGALADFGCHMLDLADYLLSGSQGKIKEVCAMCSTFITERNLIDGEGKGPVTNDDSAVFTARMESGALLSFVSSRVGMPRQMMEIIGEGGMLIMNGNHNEVEVWLKDKNGSYKNEDKKIEKVSDAFKGEEGHKGLVNELTAAVLDGKPAVRTLEWGLYVQYILDMMKKSADEGRVISV